MPSYSTCSWISGTLNLLFYQPFHLCSLGPGMTVWVKQNEARPTSVDGEQQEVARYPQTGAMTTSPAPYFLW